ncbi:MAG: peptidylprolyl isomerase [Myxococcota bacterium]
MIFLGGALVPIAGDAWAVPVGLGVLGLLLLMFLSMVPDAGSPPVERRARRRRSIAPPGESHGVHDLTLPPSIGFADAPVGLVLFGDLTDPTTRRLFKVALQLQDRYGTSVRLVMRLLPIRGRQRGQLAAQAAFEAYRQGGHEGFFSFARRLVYIHHVDRPRLEGLFEDLSLDPHKLRIAERHDARIGADRELAEALGVGRGPALVVDGRLFEPSTPASVLSDAIDGALRLRSRARRRPKESARPSDGRVYLQQIVVKWSALDGVKLKVARSRAEARERAERLHRRARQLETDFAALAKQFSDDPYELGPVQRSELAKELRKAVAHLGVDQVSPVVASDQGYHIVKRLPLIPRRRSLIPLDTEYS